MAPPTFPLPICPFLHCCRCLIIGVEFEPSLDSRATQETVCGVVQLGYRFAHILRRMLPIAMYLLQRDSQFLNGHDLFLKRVGASYHAFIEEAEKVCRGKCQEDLQSTTRYVTWSLHTKSRSSLKAMLSKVCCTAHQQLQLHLSQHAMSVCKAG